MSAFAIGLTILLAGCTLTRPQYATPDVRVGEPAFVRTLEAHTLSTPVPGNRAQVLLNGNEIFPAMLAAIRSAKSTITFANFIYEDGDISGELAAALAERCRAGVSVNVLVDAVGFLIADLLPPAYRGVYGEVERGQEAARKLASDLGAR